MFYLKAQG